MSSKFDKAYSGKWMKPADLEGEKRKFQIEAAEWQYVGREEKEEKIVLAFIGQDKPLILNPTNANALAEKWSKHEAAWVGHWVAAFAVETAMGPGIRLQPIEAPVETADIPF